MAGDTSEGHSGVSFGDGSGDRQECAVGRVSTWAVVRLDVLGDEVVAQSIMTGVVSGWFPTVPRAELEALLWHLRTSLAPATYVGDCKYVIDGAKEGVPERLVSSRSFNADLWRKVAEQLEHHGQADHKVQKTKTHRSKQAATDSMDDPVLCWVGNDTADREAKRRAQQEREEKRRSE